MKSFSMLPCVVVSALAVACGSSPQEKKETAASADTSNGGTEFVAIPLTDAGYVPYIRTFNSHYWDSTLSQVCGGDYAVDMTVEFGEVTPDSMVVNAVLVSYHASPDVTIVPTVMNVWSKEGTNVQKNDELILGRHDGDSHRYEINKRYPVDGVTAVVVEFHTAAGMPSGDSSDIACGQLAEIAYYPEGTM